MTYWMKVTHKWLSLLLSLFFVYWLITGMFLQVRKPVDWIQPPTQKGVDYKKYDAKITHDQILQAAKSVPEAKIESWKDILLLDMRLKNGIVKVRTYDWYEVQVDTTTGDVLSHNQRYNDIIGGLHSGASFGGFALGIFFIASILMVILTASGLYLCIQVTIQKIRDMRAKKAARKAMIEQGLEVPEMPKEKFSIVKFSREYHYYFSMMVFIPYLIVSFTGLMLEWRDLKGEYPGLEGASLATVRGSSTTPSLTYTKVVEIAKSIPELQAEKAKHIWRIYTYPNEGVIAMRAKRHVAVRAQIDAATGEVLDVGDFSSDYWEDWHQGIVYNVTGDRKNKGFSYDLSYNVFIIVHIVSFFFWLLGTILVLKMTFLKPKDN